MKNRDFLYHRNPRRRKFVFLSEKGGTGGSIAKYRIFFSIDTNVRILIKLHLINSFGFSLFYGPQARPFATRISALEQPDARRFDEIEPTGISIH